MAQLAVAIEYIDCISADSLTEWPGYDTKKCDTEALGMKSIPLLPSLLGPLWSRVVVLDRVLSIGWIELLQNRTVEMNKNRFCINL